MSEDRIGELLRRHYVVGLTNGESMCFECDDGSGNPVAWPCDVAYLLDALAAMTERAERYRVALESIERKADVARLGLTRHGVQDLKIVQVRDIARAALATENPS